MKKFTPVYLRPRRVVFIATMTLSLLLALGLAVVVGPTASSAAPAGASSVSTTAPFCTTDPVVANNLDSGAGSLRQAIVDACTGSTITFNMATVTSPISLTTAELTIDKNLTITGPGSTTLTIERNSAPATPQFRILNIPFNSVTLNISGLTLTKGHAPDGVAGGFAGGQGAVGGGIRNLGTLVMSDVSVTGNQSGNGGNAESLPGNGGKGGGIYSESAALTMTNCVVSGNHSGDGGGGGTGSGGGRGGDGAGIYVGGGTATLTNVTINGNTGGISTVRGGFGGMGAGIFTQAPGTVSMTSCVVSNNTAGDATGIDGTNGFAGGIFNEGLMTITKSTISGNVSHGPGGGVMNRPSAVLKLINSTLSGNSGQEGSAIYSDLTNSVVLTNCTITNHSAGGGSTVISPQTVELRNTIIAGNGLADVVGGFTSRGNNLIGRADVTSGFTNGVNNDQVGSFAAPLDPRLGPLANNGGPSQTHALLANSPALDAGNNCVLDNSCSPAVGQSLTTDQRGTGFARAADSADANTTQTVDIGAFEAQASVEDITDKFTPEDTPLSFSFNIGDAAAVTSVTASSSNAAVVPNDPANLNVTGSGSTRMLNITPLASSAGLTVITVTVSTATDSMSDTFVLTVSSVAAPPSVTNATTSEDTQTTSGLVITRNAADGVEVTHFKISAITNGTLFKNNGTTQINNGDFITATEGNAGLRFTPAANLFSPGSSFSFNVQAATSASGNGLSLATTATITVAPIADAPSVTAASTLMNAQTTSGLVVTRNAVDGAEVTHFKITNITNGTLFKNDGTTQITNNSFITNAEANGGLRFTPALNLSSPANTFSFQVQGALDASGTGLGAATTASITVTALTLSINDVSITEGNSGTSNLVFTVTLSAANTLTVNVDYATADGTAQTSDNDYQNTSGTLTFNPGDLTKTITAVINGDQKTESNETVLVNLTNPVNAIVSDAQGVGTILNDDTLQLLLDESGPAADQATALESHLFVRDPFHVLSIANWLDLGADRNTRVVLFAANLTLNQGETAAAVVVTLVDGNGQTFQVAAEDVRAVPNTTFTQVVVRLPNNLAAGVCLVTLNLHGQISNTGTMRIVQ